MDGSTETVNNGKETMKKQVLLITWILILLLAACGGGATEAPAAPTSTPTTAAGTVGSIRDVPSRNPAGGLHWRDGRWGLSLTG